MGKAQISQKPVANAASVGVAAKMPVVNGQINKKPAAKAVSVGFASKKPLMAMKVAQNVKNTKAMVVSCDELYHGVLAELNLLSGGNGVFSVNDGRYLKPGAVYDVKIRE